MEACRSQAVSALRGRSPVHLLRQVIIVAVRQLAAELCVQE